MLLWLGLLWFVGLLIDLVGCRCADFLRFSLWLIWLAFGGVAFSLLGFAWGGCGWMACLFCFGLVGLRVGWFVYVAASLRLLAGGLYDRCAY